MSDSIQNVVAFAVIATPLAIAVAYTLYSGHPLEDIAPRAGRRLNDPVAAIPPSGVHRPPNPHMAHLHRANHRVHPEDPVAALAPPSPPPNYLEYTLDPRIDGPVPIYSNIGSPRGSTVNVVPSQNQNPALDNADIDASEEGGHV